MLFPHITTPAFWISPLFFFLILFWIFLKKIEYSLNIFWKKIEYFLNIILNIKMGCYFHTLSRLHFEFLLCLLFHFAFCILHFHTLSFCISPLFALSSHLWYPPMSNMRRLVIEKLKTQTQAFPLLVFFIGNLFSGKLNQTLFRSGRKIKKRNGRKSLLDGSDFQLNKTSKGLSIISTHCEVAWWKLSRSVAKILTTWMIMKSSAKRQESWDP